MEFSIELYETANGRAVVEAELEALEKRSPVLHALLIAGLNKLKQRVYHRPPLSLPVGEGLFDLRVGRTNIARGLWFFQKGHRIIVVRCFVKKTQRTPSTELELTRKRMQDYLSRHEE